MFSSSKSLLGAVLSFLVLTGCQQSAPNATENRAAPEASRVVTAADKVEKPSQKESDKLLTAMTEYEPPYPTRRDKFIPPKVGLAPRSNDDGVAAVQLKGLVNVGEPRAVLDIEGATTLLAVGSEKYGVRVISIDDLKVTLERGRTRWTASLE